MLPVAIVGGGPVGLVSSILLSMRKIPHVIFEQFPGTSIHPKACGLNQRTMEIFRHIGVEREVVKHRAPLNVAGKTGWYTNIGPNGREIYSRDSWGGGKYQEEYRRASPAQYSTLAQIRLEPILQRRALEIAPNCISYNSKVTSVKEKGDKVVLTVDRGNRGSEDVEAQYVLGADGGRGLAESLGIGWEGESDIVDMFTAHFNADIASIHPNKAVFISWLVNPKLRGSRGSGYLYHLGPYYPTREKKEEWVLASPKHPEDPVEFDEKTMVERIRRSLEIPDLDLSLRSISNWTVNAKVAERYRSEGGRIFLVGDACHRVPPWGALGMNSGIQDAHNLIWKLGLALKSGQPTKYSNFLDTYEKERRPIAQRVARNSLHNMLNHNNIMDGALDITAETSTEENLASVAAYFDESHELYKEKRERVRQAAADLDNEFHAPGIEIGWFYESADINGEGLAARHGGQLLADGTFDINNYHPSTIPGHHVPHSWLRKGDTTISTRDLVELDKFVLLTGKSGIWESVPNDLIHVQVIDGEAGWTDIEGTWAQLRGVDEDGAVLIRPDGIVAWRARNSEPSSTSKLTALVQSLLYQKSDRRWATHM
ncbi:hypothetical protein LTR84_012413 [Exophiala bonariae]|uniref:FAD-binding domain-containing protein n=1 Tax=Exophiala bonariae TaxID=1690606 RepID=A0AAV9MRJ0_9EURO|nr:hypothetical protein LTR84_012413 [Exophiala bonariae]